jgi:hypothetical protein
MPVRDNPKPAPPTPQNTSLKPPQFPPNREVREGDRPPKR